MQHGMNSLLNPSSSSPSTSPIQFHHNMQIPPPNFHDPASSSSDDFLDQMLSAIHPSPWSDLPENDSNNAAPDAGGPVGGYSGFDVSAVLSSKMRQHQINGGHSSGVNKLMLHQQQQLLMASRATAGGNLLQNDAVLLDNGGFNSSPTECKGSIQSLYPGFSSGSQHHYPPPQVQAFQASNQPAPVPVPPPQPQVSGSSSGGGIAPASQQPKPRVRARRGQATDPHSIAERLRRERIAERMKSLQELVPNANKTDKASMLDEIIDYVKFLQLQVKVLSVSRLGGAAAVTPLVADMSSEGGATSGDCLPPSVPNAVQKESMTVTEHQVAKMMEEDMGSAMQYLQGKGLCLMPISLATAISTATCHGRNAPISIGGGNLRHANGETPTSPNISGLSVQSAAIGNPIGDGSSKDAATDSVN